MDKFTITDEMKKRVKENKKGIESRDLDTMRTYGIAFCSEFYKELLGDFDTRGNREDGMYLMYVSAIGIGYTVIIDGDVRRDTGKEFLDTIYELETQIRNLKDRLGIEI